MEDVDFSGAGSNNTRIRAIRRFLAKPHRRCEHMNLQVAGEEQVHVLRSWNRDEIKPELAEEIDELMREHVEEVSAVVSGALQMCDKSGVQLSIKALNYRPESSPGTGTIADLVSDPKDLTGDARSMAVQAQKHLEVIMRMSNQQQFQTFTLMKQISEHLADMTEMMATRIVESESRERRATQRADELETVLEEVKEAQGDDAATIEAQGRITKLLEPYAPLIAQMIMKALSSGMSGGGGAPPPSGET